MTATALIEKAREINAPVTIRPPAEASDFVDDVAPGIVIEPETASAVAATLAWASERQLSVVLRGSGTKDRWGRHPSRVDVLLRLGRLNRVIAHEAGDLTATVEAGARLSDVNLALAAGGQFLPLDPPHAGLATIGGIVASNDSGPLRHRFGTPRDLIIGIQVASTDGTLANAGGRVVKNVAGYDLGRMMAGAAGNLGAIVSATFKLAPLPVTSTTMVAEFESAGFAQEAVSVLTDRQMEPVQIDLRAAGTGPHTHLLVRHAGARPVVQQAVADTLGELTRMAITNRTVHGEDEEAAWREHLGQPWKRPDAAVVRLSWRPSEFARAVDVVGRVSSGGGYVLIGRAHAASGLVRLDGDVAAQAAAIERLRQDEAVGQVTIVSGSVGLRERCDAWPPPGDEALIWPALVDACDPRHVLNAGRGPM